MSTAKEVKDLSTLKPEYLECRDLHHAWAVVGYYTDRSDGTVRRKLQCARCPTAKIQVRRLTTGQLIRRGARYEYPPDYLVKGGVDRKVLWKEIVKNVQIFANEEEMLENLFKSNGRRKRVKK